MIDVISGCSHCGTAPAIKTATAVWECGYCIAQLPNGPEQLHAAIMRMEIAEIMEHGDSLDVLRDIVGWPVPTGAAEPANPNYGCQRCGEPVADDGWCWVCDRAW